LILRKVSSNRGLNIEHHIKEDIMFNSPLHYCKGCKQYVELDQSAKECAEQHGCGKDACPCVHLFIPPAPSSDANIAERDRPFKR